MYKRDIWTFKDSLEVEEKHTGRYGAPGQRREKKKKATPEQIKKQNQWMKVRKVRRLIKWNFTEGDYWLTFTYSCILYTSRCVYETARIDYED